MTVVDGFVFKTEAEKLAEDLVQREGHRLENIYDALAAEGGKNDNPNQQVQSHDGRQILLPTGMSDGQGANILARKAEADNEPFVHVGRYKYKPWDGAVALKSVLTDLFGAAVTPTKGSNGVIEVPIDAHGGTLSVPWGEFDLKWRDKMVRITLDSYHDEEYGLCFQAVFQGIDRFKFELLGLSRRVQKQLETNSIYKGKSIKFSKVRDMPDFTDPYATDKHTVAYSKDVFEELELALFGRLDTIEIHREMNEPIAQQIVLEGDYGVGKTLALNLAAQKANEMGWTYIQAKAGEDNIEEVRSFAKLYAPAIIGIEDADHLVDTGIDPDGKKLSSMLEQFDSASGKNAEIGIVMTTNHIDKFPAPMRRPGRLDHVIHIGNWDGFAFERGVRGKFDATEIGDVDWDQVSEAMEGFTPAFIMSVLGDTRSASIVRTKSRWSKLTTEDFLAVAQLKRGTFDDFQRSKEMMKKDTYYELQQAFHQEAVATVLGDGSWSVDLSEGTLLHTAE